MGDKLAGDTVERKLIAFVAVIIVKCLLAHVLTSIGQKERRPFAERLERAVRPRFPYFCFFLTFGGQCAGKQVT